MHRAYLAHVPHSMDEKAFWTRYFKQQYKRMARRYAFTPTACPPSLLRQPAAVGRGKGGVGRAAGDACWLRRPLLSPPPPLPHIT
jgi:hypothetical protein